MIIGPFFVFHIQRPVPREQQPVAGIAGGHDTIEHVHSQRHILQKIFRSPNPHQVARLVFRQNVANQFRHGVHVFMRFTDTQPSDCIALRAPFRNGMRRSFPQIFEGRSLNDGKERLIVSVQCRRCLQVFDAAIQPAMRSLHGFARVAVIAWIRGAFVEGHDDVRTDAALNVHRCFRTEQVLAPVDVAAEGYPLFCNLASIGQAKDLVTAAVCQNGPVPMHEPMQAARFFENFRSRAQIQVIRIT